MIKGTMQSTSRHRGCVNPVDSFCYVCGQFTTTAQRKAITKQTKTAYRLYFGCMIGDQDKPWAPHVCCVTCKTMLGQWLHGTRKAMPFAVPMVWREPKSHLNDCYFCMTKVAGFSGKSKHKIEYPNLPSALRPVPHCEGLPVPVPPSSWDEESEDEQNEAVAVADHDDDVPYSPDEEDDHSPHFVEQEELNDLVRDLKLSKELAQLLGSRLQQWNLFAKETRISVFRNRHKAFSVFFKFEDEICYCTDVNGLMEKLGYDHHPEEWRLFIDSSKTSLKAVLLHNGNKKPSIPLAHAVDMKETYESMELILKSINYKDHEWFICGDLKVVALILGLQLGYTKYSCFLCLWDSRADSLHYKQKVWPSRENVVPGQSNVKFAPLVDTKKIILPPLHIKLGLMKNFVKAMNKEEDGFKYLRKTFPKLSDAKLKEGVFVGPQIRKLLNDMEFETALNRKELRAWKSFKNVVSGFLGNNKEENYQNLISELLKAYEEMGCRMSLKIHFLHSHLEFFHANMGAVSDEQGERFHQDILAIEQRYQGRWDPAMLGDYCWFLQREAKTTYKRKFKSTDHDFYRKN